MMNEAEEGGARRPPGKKEYGRGWWVPQKQASGDKPSREKRDTPAPSPLTRPPLFDLIWPFDIQINMKNAGCLSPKASQRGSEEGEEVVRPKTQTSTEVSKRNIFPNNPRSIPFAPFPPAK